MLVAREKRFYSKQKHFGDASGKLMRCNTISSGLRKSAYRVTKKLVEQIIEVGASISKIKFSTKFIISLPPILVKSTVLSSRFFRRQIMLCYFEYLLSIRLDGVMCGHRNYTNCMKS